MWKVLRLVMKQQFQFPRFGSTLKICTVFIVLTATTSLACGGGRSSWVGGAGAANDKDNDKDWQAYLNAIAGDTMEVAELDDELVLNFTGVKGPMDRNIKSGWLNWEPADVTKKFMNLWYDKFLEDNAKNGELTWQEKKKMEKAKAKKGDGGNGTVKPELKRDFSAERGPKNGWPDLPGWADLGVGNGGTPVPPWAWAPRNINKPYLCYLPPLKGNCNKFVNITKTPVIRWGYNPHTDRCWKYEYSGCGGTRNNFFERKQCQNHCERMPPAGCSIDSGFKDTSPN